MKKRYLKRGQIDISFGLIFSVILIIAFLSFAIYGIVKFLGIKNKVQVGQFLNNFQTDIDKVWKSSQSNQEVSYFLPSKIKEVCIIDKTTDKKGIFQTRYEELKRNSASKENLVFYPVGSSQTIRGMEASHLDLQKITQIQNPICFNNTKGKVSFSLEKGFQETLVTVRK